MSHLLSHMGYKRSTTTVKKIMLGSLIPLKRDLYLYTHTNALYLFLIQFTNGKKNMPTLMPLNLTKIKT